MVQRICLFAETSSTGGADSKFAVDADLRSCMITLFRFSQTSFSFVSEQAWQPEHAGTSCGYMSAGMKLRIVLENDVYTSSCFLWLVNHGLLKAHHICIKLFRHHCFLVGRDVLSRSLKKPLGWFGTNRPDGVQCFT